MCTSNDDNHGYIKVAANSVEFKRRGRRELVKLYCNITTKSKYTGLIIIYKRTCISLIANFKTLWSVETNGNDKIKNISTNRNDTNTNIISRPSNICFMGQGFRCLLQCRSFIPVVITTNITNTNTVTIIGQIITGILQ